MQTPVPLPAIPMSKAGGANVPGSVGSTDFRSSEQAYRSTAVRPSTHSGTPRRNNDIVLLHFESCWRDHQRFFASSVTGLSPLRVEIPGSADRPRDRGALCGSGRYQLFAVVRM